MFYGFDYHNESELFWRVTLATISLGGAETIVGCLLFFSAGWIVRNTYPELATQSDGQIET